MTCESCRFWKEHFSDKKGNCCRYPPKLIDFFLKQSEDILEDLLFVGTRFPVTQHDEFCGEFKEKDDGDLRQDSNRDYE